MELLECVQKRHRLQFWQQLSPSTLPPANKHKVSRDQLCVTQQHNQSVDIPSIDSPQKSLLLFDDLLLPFVFSITLTSIFALWCLCPLFNPAPTFTLISVF